jgi:hypothetical protein
LEPEYFVPMGFILSNFGALFCGELEGVYSLYLSPLKQAKPRKNGDNHAFFALFR